MNQTESRCIGSIVGLAVGDAIGYPAEFRRRAQILAEIGNEGIHDFIALKDPVFRGHSLQVLIIPRGRSRMTLR
jgi:hypothetical protein